MTSLRPSLLSPLLADGCHVASILPNLPLQTLVQRHYQLLFLPQPVMQIEQSIAEGHDCDLHRSHQQLPLRQRLSSSAGDLSWVSQNGSDRLLPSYPEHCAAPLITAQCCVPNADSMVRSPSPRSHLYPSSAPTSGNRVTHQIDRQRRRARRALVREHISELRELLQEHGLPVRSSPAVLRSCTWLIQQLAAKNSARAVELDRLAKDLQRGRRDLDLFCQGCLAVRGFVASSSVETSM